MNNIYHFYHIYADGMWQEPVIEHLDALLRFGLYDNLKSFNIGIVGSIENRNAVKNFLNCYNLQKLIYCNETDSGWEQETLDYIQDFSQNNDGYVLYTHTKTASNYNDLHVRWRKTMEFYNVVNWKKCIDLLNQDYTTVGCYYYCHPDGSGLYFYYAGNFWWGHLKYVKLLHKCIRHERYDAEFWTVYFKIILEQNNLQFKYYDFIPEANGHVGSEIGRVLSW